MRASKRPKRTRLATGIYKDASGVVIRISVQGSPVDYRRDTDDTSYLAHYERDGVDWLR